jgi:hypothetical protein
VPSLHVHARGHPGGTQGGATRCPGSNPQVAQAPNRCPLLACNPKFNRGPQSSLLPSTARSPLGGPKQIKLDFHLLLLFVLFTTHIPLSPVALLP